MNTQKTLRKIYMPVTGITDENTKSDITRLANLLLSLWREKSDPTAVPCYNLLTSALRQELLRECTMAIDNLSDPQLILLTERKFMFLWTKDSETQIIEQYQDCVKSLMKLTDVSFAIGNVQPQLAEILHRFCLEMKYSRVERITKFHLGTLEKKDFIKPEIQSSFKGRAISSRDIDTVFANFKFGNSHTGFLDPLVDKENFSCCLLNPRGEIISMVIDYGMARVGMLSTLPEYRNQGLATIVVSTISEKILRRGPYIPQAGFIMNSESAIWSQKAFTRCGYRIHKDTPLTLLTVIKH